jgi:hypothetical protein
MHRIFQAVPGDWFLLGLMKQSPVAPAAMQ